MRLLIAGLLITLSLGAGDNGLAPGFDLPNKERKLSPLEALKEFEAPFVDSYVLGEADEISIEVWGRPELTGKHVIGPDGQITLPVAGPLRLSGLDREAALDAIVGRLSNYYLEPVVTLRVDRYASNRVFILGRVAQPGALYFETQPTLLEAITRAGSLPVGTGSAAKTQLTRCAIFRGRDRVAWVDLKALLASGDMEYNLRLARNDVVYIPDTDDQLVHVLGEVQRPGAYPLTSTMTFLDAFSQAGGLTKDAAADQVYLLRTSTGKKQLVPLRQLLQADEPRNVSLEEGDVIYVPKRNLARVGYAMEKLNPFTSFLLFGSALKP